MQRIGLFGGTFDPVHNAHVILAQRAQEVCALDEVVILPAGRPPHRSEPPLLSATERVEFARLAFEGLKGFRIDDREIHRQGPSWTYLTVREFADEFPHAELWWCLGSDSVASLPTWREAGELGRRLRFVALPRPGPELRQDPGGFRILWLEDAPLGISSTLVRKRWAEGKSLRGYVPERVLQRLPEAPRFG